MAVIFYFSSRPGDISSLQSEAILIWFKEHFGNGSITDFAVRKSAHFLEFAGLCFLFCVAWYCTKGRRMPAAAVACTSVYAITDEIHQLFVEGRSCQVFDWLLDTMGGIMGALGFIFIMAVIRNVKKQKNSN